MAGVILSAELASSLLEHATAELPNEACALLAGSREAGRVRSIHPARNMLASPYRYEVDPEDLVRILHAIEGRGDDLVAIFHSHPTGPAVPSSTDVRETRYRALHLVAGLAAGHSTLRAWRLDGDGPSEVPLAIV